MKKSKFLKKSLAALLAILMVAAMIPLSAAAEEAPEPEGPENPTITVNNRNATATTAEDGSVSYAVTVQDATTVSIAWKSQEGYSPRLEVKSTTIVPPFPTLDLITEATPVDKDGNVTTADKTNTFMVTFRLVDEEDPDDKTKWHDYPVYITTEITVPNDDTLIKEVVANQEFRLNNVDYKFSGIEAEISNDPRVITITLPLGMNFANAGFSDGNSSVTANTYANQNTASASTRNFGRADGVVHPKGIYTEGTPPTGSNIFGNVDLNNQLARRVFVPNSVYSNVNYTAPDSVNGTGRLTVTARDGHSENYTVVFQQEEPFTDVAAKYVDNNNKVHTFPSKSVTVDDQGVLTYNIDVPESEWNTADTARGAGYSLSQWTAIFKENKNVVRVEDPYDYDGSTGYAAYTTRSVWTQSGASDDLPIKSDENVITFVKPTNRTNISIVDGDTALVAYLSVKTLANMDPNAEGVESSAFFQDVKLVLRKVSDAQASAVPVLKEIQINGYQAKFDLANGLGNDIEYWVSYDFEFSTGDGQHPARISATVENTRKVSVPAQDARLVSNRFWAVTPVTPTSGRVTKPSTYTAAIPNVRIDESDDPSFVLRLTGRDGNNYDYTIHIKKPTQNTGTTPTTPDKNKDVGGVRLVDGDGKTVAVATRNRTDSNFKFQLPAEDLEGAAGVPVPGQFAWGGTIAANANDNGTFTTGDTNNYANQATDASSGTGITISKRQSIEIEEILLANDDFKAETLNNATSDQYALVAERGSDNIITLKTTIGSTEVVLGTCDISGIVGPDTKTLDFKRAGTNASVASIDVTNVPIDGGVAAVWANNATRTYANALTVTHPDKAGSADTTNGPHGSDITGVDVVTTAVSGDADLSATAGKTYTSAKLTFTLEGADATAQKATRKTVYDILKAEWDNKNLKDDDNNVQFKIRRNGAILTLYAVAELADGTFTNPVDIATGALAGADPTSDKIAFLTADNTQIGEIELDNAFTGGWAASNITYTWDASISTATMTASTTSAGASAKIVSSRLKNYYLVIDVPAGAVVTPGASNLNGRTTAFVGKSLWGVGIGYNVAWPNNNNSAPNIPGYSADALYNYLELENGVTKFGDWWTLNYTLKNNRVPYTSDELGATTTTGSVTTYANGTNAADSDAVMYFSVSNGRDGIPQGYTITLEKKPVLTDTDLSEDASIDFTSALATTGVDDDLVYGGHTVTNSILHQTNGKGNTVLNTEGWPNVSTGTVDTDYNSGLIDPSNSAYIGAIGATSFKNVCYGEDVIPEAAKAAGDPTIEIRDIDDRSKAVVIHMPADFKGASEGADTISSTTGRGDIYFAGLTASASAQIWVGDVGGTTATMLSDIDDLNLEMTKQQKQGTPPIKFTFDSTGPNNFSVWNGKTFQREYVSPNQILYVISEKTASANTVTAANAMTLADAIYYITVERDDYGTDDKLTKVESANGTTVQFNEAQKIVTLQVPFSYNWTGTRKNGSHDFNINFETSKGALVIDAVQDHRFTFFRPGNDTSVIAPLNFTSLALVQQEQDVAQWVAKKSDATVNPTTFFVKNNELYSIDLNTGIETQITGMGDNENDRFMNYQWGHIETQQAEIRVYNESRTQLNTYKLQLEILPITNFAEITSLIVDETTAVVDNEGNPRTATVTLPNDTDLEHVHLRIATNNTAKIVSVNEKEYDANNPNSNTYNITEPISIVIEAEDGTQYTYTLRAGDEPVEPADATITSLTVDGVAATVNNTARTATVELPEGSDLSKVKLAIEVSEGDELVSVAGEEFDPEAEYDLSEDIAIVIKAEDGTEYTYTLTGTVAQPVDPVNPADKYTDLDKIQKEETRDEVKKAINLGLMNGISESKGIFGVGMNMERYQFALVVARADIREQLLAEDANADVSTEALNKRMVELYPDNYTFTDVAEKVPQKAAAAAVEYCYKKGYINGKSLANKIFDPTGNITREEAAKIMVEWAGLEHDDTDVSAIPDGDQISNWAKGYVKAAADAGIMKGRTDGNFAPKAALQRQDGACLLVRTYENFIVNKGDDDNTPDDDDDNNGDDDTNTPDDDENNGDDSSTPDDGDNSSTPDEGGDDDTSSTPDDGDTSSTPDEGGESEPAE